MNTFVRKFVAVAGALALAALLAGPAAAADGAGLTGPGLTYADARISEVGSAMLANAAAYIAEVEANAAVFRAAIFG